MRTSHSQKGFTIVELLVSIAIFALITSFGVTVFIRSLRAQRTVVSLMAASDNASLAIEAIGREIRRGRDFSTNGLALCGATDLSFVNAEQRSIIYRFDSSLNAITRSENGTGFYPVTAKNIVVEDASFCVRNADALGRATLPRVTIWMKLSSQDRDVADITTEIQTTVSSRGLNNPLPPNP